MKLPAELKSPASKITIKNVFYGVILGILILIRQTNKELANDLDYDGVEFPVREKDFSKTETKNN